MSIPCETRSVLSGGKNHTPRGFPGVPVVEYPRTLKPGCLDMRRHRRHGLMDLTPDVFDFSVFIDEVRHDGYRRILYP